MFDSITVGQLCCFYIEDTDPVIIYNLDSGENVFEGYFRAATYSDFADTEVQSFGIEDGIIVINIADE